MKEWSQNELESIFVRSDLYESQRRDMEKDIEKLQDSMEWFQRLIISQGVILIVAIILFVVERVSQ